MKKYIFIFFVGVWINIYNSPTYKSELPFYYSLQNVDENIQKEKVSHAACQILIDITRNELPASGKMTTVTLNLINGLRCGFFPILTSHSLLYNAIKHSIDSSLSLHSDLSQNPFLADRWYLYEIPGYDFLLFIPKEFNEYYKSAGLNVSNLINLSHLLPQNSSQEGSKPLLEYLEGRTAKPIRMLKNPMDFMRDVFRQKSLFIWDFIIIGHGAKDKIANLNMSGINWLLSFFDTMSTGVVYILSCFAGGSNLKLLEFNESGITIAHSYTIINGAIADIAISIPPEVVKNNITSFFNNAAYLADRGASLDRLIKFLTIDERVGIVGSIPQIWLPGGIGFTTFTVDEKILNLNTVMLRKHELEKKDIIIKDKQAVLLYPLAIDVNLDVDAKIYKHQKRLSFKFPNSILPDISELIEKVTLVQNIELLAQILGLEPFLAFDRKLLEFKKEIQETLYQYPFFIGMAKGSSVGHFKKITVAQSLPNKGVFKFVRDSFLNIPYALDTKKFLIDEISGPNDLASILTILQLDRADTNTLISIFKTSDEQKQKKIIDVIKRKYQETKRPIQEHIGTLDQITLKNCIISVSREKIIYDFELEKTAWHLEILASAAKPKAQDIWPFTQKDRETHQNEYRDLLKQIKE